MPEPSAAVSPTSAEVRSHIQAAAKKHGDILTVRTIDRSGEGRPVDAVTASDKSVPDKDKQNVLVVAGQHGNEESGRMVALALIDWLGTRAGRGVLRKQKIVVMPNVNPDGAERDIHGTPAGVQPNLDHAPGGAKTPEGRAVESVAERLQPEVFVDLHARGYSGCSHDMVLYPRVKTYTEDDNLFHEIAADMARAGEAAGLPQVTHPLWWWTGDDPADEASTTHYAYRRFKSIVMLTENSESNEYAFPARLRASTGLAKLRALLAWGSRRHPHLYYAGYPNQLVAGSFHLGVVAVGTTAARRRRSRVAAWTHVAHFKRLAMSLPEPPRLKTIEIEYTGPRLGPVGFQLRAAGRLSPESVTLDGRKLRQSETDGYYTWRDACSTLLVVAVASLRPGRHQAVIKYG